MLLKTPLSGNISHRSGSCLCWKVEDVRLLQSQSRCHPIPSRNLHEKNKKEQWHYCSTMSPPSFKRTGAVFTTRILSQPLLCSLYCSLLTLSLVSLRESSHSTLYTAACTNQLQHRHQSLSPLGNLHSHHSHQFTRLTVVSDVPKAVLGAEQHPDIPEAPPAFDAQLHHQLFSLN